MSELKVKPHYVEISITSFSDGVVNSQSIHREFASTPNELVEKTFAMTEGVVGGLIGAAKALAKPYLGKMGV
jgi:hypothetical protein